MLGLSECCNLLSDFSALFAFFCFSFTLPLPPSYARLWLEEPLERWPDLFDEIGGGDGAPVPGEGLGGAGPTEPGSRPPGDDPRSGVRAVGLEARAPVHEDGARPGQQVALAATSAMRRRERAWDTRDERQLIQGVRKVWSRRWGKSKSVALGVSKTLNVLWIRNQCSHGESFWNTGWAPEVGGK